MQRQEAGIASASRRRLKEARAKLRAAADAEWLPLPFWPICSSFPRSHCRRFSVFLLDFVGSRVWLGCAGPDQLGGFFKTTCAVPPSSKRGHHAPVEQSSKTRPDAVRRVVQRHPIHKSDMCRMSDVACPVRHGWFCMSDVACNSSTSAGNRLAGHCLAGDGRCDMWNLCISNRHSSPDLLQPRPESLFLF